jgi:L-malate glycosyltransferase
MNQPGDDFRCEVIHLNTERSMRGGEVQTLGLMRRLVEGGVPCLLAGRRDGVLLKRAADQGLAAVGLRMRGEFDLASAAAIRGLLKRSDAKILHCHTAHALGLALWATLGLSSRPAVVASRRVSFPLRGRASRWKYRRADAVVAVSEEVRTALLTQGLSPSKVITIHSGVDLGRFRDPPTREASRARFGIAPEAVAVGAVGALVEHKGHGDLIQALAGLRARGMPVLLVLAGDGPLKESLGRQASALGVEVRFLGYVDEPAQLYPALDVLAMPSLSGEGSPGAIKEAAAAGVPVVATAVSGTEEILRDGEEALLVPPGDPGRLEEGMRRLLADPSLARALSDAALKRVREFSMDRMARAHVELYGTLSRESRVFREWREPRGSRGRAS